MYNLHSIEDWFVCAMCISKQNQINHKTIEIRCLVFWFLFFRLCKWMKPFGDTTSIDRTAMKNAFWNDGIHSVNHLEQQFLFVVIRLAYAENVFEILNMNSCPSAVIGLELTEIVCARISCWVRHKFYAPKSIKSI